MSLSIWRCSMDERIAKAIADVRRTCLTNMFDRTMVIEIMDMLGNEEEADYLRNNLQEYGRLLRKSGDY